MIINKQGLVVCKSVEVYGDPEWYKSNGIVCDFWPPNHLIHRWNQNCHLCLYPGCKQKIATSSNKTSNIINHIKNSHPEAVPIVFWTKKQKLTVLIIGHIN